MLAKHTTSRAMRCQVYIRCITFSEVIKLPTRDRNMKVYTIGYVQLYYCEIINSLYLWTMLS